jgi:cytochrome b561
MQKSDSNIRDSQQSFGWVSIALHWVTAIVIFVLWFLGDSIAAQDGDLVDQRRDLHVSIALSAYLVLIFRIYWRFRIGHPHVSGQTMRIHLFAQAVHYILLISVAVMLISGPVMVWANGGSLSIFGLVSIPWPFASSPSMHASALAVHTFTGTIIVSLTVLHIAGALKQLMFNEDETIIRMIRPRRHKPDS